MTSVRVDGGIAISPLQRHFLHLICALHRVKKQQNIGMRILDDRNRIKCTKNRPRLYMVWWFRRRGTMPPTVCGWPLTHDALPPTLIFLSFTLYLIKRTLNIYIWSIWRRKSVEEGSLIKCLSRRETLTVIASHWMKNDGPRVHWIKYQ